MYHIFIAALFLFLSNCTQNVHKGTKDNYPRLEKIAQEDQPNKIFIQSTSNNTLSALYFKSKTTSNNKKLLIQFHGNSRNISDLFHSQSWVTQSGIDFLSFDYRGYGKSSGKANFPGVSQDGVAILKYAHEKFPQHKIYLWAESLGGMIALHSLKIYLKNNPLHNISALILEGSFASLIKVAQHDMQQGHLAPLSFMAKLLISDTYAPLKQLSDTVFSFPVLSIHSQKDKVIPFAQGQQLYHLISTSQKCKLWLPDEFHIRSALIDNKKNQSFILKFLSRGCRSS